MTTAPDVIRAKRDGHELTDQQIRWFINGYTAGEVAPEQAAALLMAIVWRGLNAKELATWTDAMIATGRRADLSPLAPTADKHSTGGVGDKISLVLCPLVAACGVRVPQLSGRGLGHTGGTLDKLEAIPGWRAVLSAEEYMAQLRDVGAVICAASDDLAPADKLLYALRDVTATVESIPLIASSIMSKKIAEGTQNLVLDVKVGEGAFMADIDRARELATTMVALGETHGVRTRALLTDMDTPLGRTAGNALEVREALDVLHGGGPRDVVSLTVELARHMLEMAGRGSVDPAAVLASGAALTTWRQMIAAQGGDPDAALPHAAVVEVVHARGAGVVVGVHSRPLGEAAWLLGAGRARPGDGVDAAAGVVWRVDEGDVVVAGQPLVELHTSDPTRLELARERAERAIVIGPPGTNAGVPVRQIVRETIDGQ